MANQSKDIPVLNGIRALAVLIVFVSHASNIFFQGALAGLGAGQLGVMLFFMLSGFLMAFLYMGKPSNPRAQRTFIVNRIARIYPMFLVVVVACFAINLTAPSLWVYPIKSPRDVLEHLFFIRGYDVLWTIGPEVIFYGLFLGLWRVRRNQGLFLAMTAVLVGVAWLPLNISGSNSLFELHDKLPYFMVGCLLGMRPEALLECTCFGKNRWLPAVAFWASLAIFVVSFPQTLRLIMNVPKMLTGDPWPNPWAYPFYLAATAAVFVTAIVARPRVLANKVSDFIGKVSFSFYLLHYAVLENMWTWMPTRPLLSTSLALVITLAVSSVSYALIEVPFRNLIRRMGPGKNVALGSGYVVS